MTAGPPACQTRVRSTPVPRPRPATPRPVRRLTGRPTRPSGRWPPVPGPGGPPTSPARHALSTPVRSSGANALRGYRNRTNLPGPPSPSAPGIRATRARPGLTTSRPADVIPLQPLVAQAAVPHRPNSGRPDPVAGRDPGGPHHAGRFHG
ncbi:hypothetical protein FRUB_05804 [Fimbriiglobus ruber]|uniref:Uncharacterized protein n=1 Tax=Fimbriiglobus ruber TaxID=1908690 RepID=A0A225DJN2_9BACT|nr:hypothetical protein FRUB_05804 [Fimbriiglobus ruber]